MMRRESIGTELSTQLASFYVSRPNEQLETKELVIPGEDPEEDAVDDNDKPVRILTDFSIFDPLHRNEMVSLAAIEEDDGVDRSFEGAGWVTANFIDEDVGQEDWEDEEEEEEKVYVRLGAILRYTLDYRSDYE
jgi:DNA (cytosine-5)-methyltransferase 1